MKIGVGVEAGVTYHHLTLVRNMGCRPGDKFQIVHPLQRKERANHVLSHPLGLFLGGSFDLAVDREAGMAPACDLLHQGLRDELFPKEQGEDFALEELGHQAVLELSEMMKRPLKVLASLGHQEVDSWMMAGYGL